MKTALITGASAGIGYELAQRFAQDGHDVVLVARSKNVLNELAAEIEHRYGVKATVIAADLAESSAPDRIYETLKELGIHVDFLINNAGFGTFGLFAETDVNRELELIQVNITALTHLTKLFLPGMIERRSGRILNVASTAAFQPGPLMAVYFASKAFVLSLSEALANELKGTGVTVTALCPGATQTQFQQNAKMEKSKLFQGGVMEVKTVAVEGYQAMMAGKTLAIPGFKNKVGALSVRFVPRKWMPTIVRKVQEEV